MLNNIRSLVGILYTEYPPVLVKDVNALYFRIQFLKDFGYDVPYELMLLSQQACLSEALAANSRGESTDYLLDFIRQRNPDAYKRLTQSTVHFVHPSTYYNLLGETYAS